MPIQVVFFPELVNASVKGVDCLSEAGFWPWFGVGVHFYLHHDPVFIYMEPGFLNCLCDISDGQLRGC
jgi:hypothetical protein